MALRFFVLERQWSAIASPSASMNASLIPCRRSTVANAAGNRPTTVAAGAKGSATGSKVDSLTNRLTWGFQNRTVAYQSPRTVVG